MPDQLSDRERRVLEAVIQTYIETAEPAGSRTIAKRYPMGVSAATIRNTMSDLEERGFLYHPHTSAGRIPTDRAYRAYVDRLMVHDSLVHQDRQALTRQLRSDSGVIEDLLRKAADVLGVLTRELGVAVAPSFDTAVLERLELMQVSADRLLMVLVIRGGLARTIYLELVNQLPSEAIDSVASVLNERLSGLMLRDIRGTVKDRLRDTTTAASDAQQLLNIFIEESDTLFNPPGDGRDVMLGSAQLLAGQPEFASNTGMLTLLDLTERRDRLREALQTRESGVTVTIGGENQDPSLSSFTIVTASYRQGPLSGVIGVMGPTRMPYRKVMALVEHTSRLVEEFAD